MSNYKITETVNGYTVTQTREVWIGHLVNKGVAEALVASLTRREPLDMADSLMEMGETAGAPDDVVKLEPAPSRMNPEAAKSPRPLSEEEYAAVNAAADWFAAQHGRVLDSEAQIAKVRDEVAALQTNIPASHGMQVSLAQRDEYLSGLIDKLRAAAIKDAKALIQSIDETWPEDIPGIDKLLVMIKDIMDRLPDGPEHKKLATLTQGLQEYRADTEQAEAKKTVEVVERFNRWLKAIRAADTMDVLKELINIGNRLKDEPIVQSHAGDIVTKEIAQAIDRLALMVSKSNTTPPPAWKGSKPNEHKAGTLPSVSDLLKFALAKVDSAQGITLTDLRDHIQKQYKLAPKQLDLCVADVQKLGKLVAFNNLPDGTSRLFSEEVPTKGPLSDLEERVLDEVISFVGDEKRHLANFEEADLKKRFKGSDSRDCMKALDALHDKNWLAILWKSATSRIVRIHPE